MNRNIIIILLIFLVPLVAYFGLSRDKLTTPPSFASSGPEVIKFASPTSVRNWKRFLKKFFLNTIKTLH